MSKLWLPLLVLLVTAGLRAEPRPEPTSPLRERPSSPYTVHTDRVPSIDGKRHFRVVTCIPRKGPTGQGHPVVYALDGNAVMHHLSEARLEAVSAGEAPVIVAIGYETDALYELKSRAFDYTPARRDGSHIIDPLDPARTGGGARGFLDFLEKRVIPLVEGRSRIDPRRRVLFGHSYGGLFVLSALLERPDLFRTYVSADPSLWWDSGDFHRQLMLRSASLDLVGRRILLLKGGLEEPNPAARRDPERLRLRNRLLAGIPRDATLEVLRALAARPGTQTRYLEFGHLSHGPLFPVSLELALQAATEP